MNPTMTVLVVEHLVTGLLTIGALFVAMGPEPRLQILASSIPSSLRLMVGVACTYIIGVVLAHVAARFYERLESRVYLRVLHDTDAYPADILWESLSAWRLEEGPPGQPPDGLTAGDSERIFSLMRYSLLSDSALKDRISYYQTMVRICRNNILPLGLAAAAFFMRFYYEQATNGLLIVLGAAALGLAVACYFAAVGYSEWLGYATLRGFIALSAKAKAGRGEGQTATGIKK